MISIIIPALDEETSLPAVVTHIRKSVGGSALEVIVSDGGSSDKTAEVALKLGCAVVRSPRGRAVQMNAGAAAAHGDILYFLHADSFPPAGFANSITAAVKTGATAGCFRLRFDDNHWFLRLNAWFTRFDVDAFRFGDQSLFVTRDAFQVAGGFDPGHIVLEDQEMVTRLRRRGKFVVLPQYVTTSARKYHDNGAVRLQLIYFYIYFLYRMGYPQEELVRRYRSLVRRNPRL